MHGLPEKFYARMLFVLLAKGINTAVLGIATKVRHVYFRGIAPYQGLQLSLVEHRKP